MVGFWHVFLSLAAWDRAFSTCIAPFDGGDAACEAVGAQPSPGLSDEVVLLQQWSAVAAGKPHSPTSKKDKQKLQPDHEAITSFHDTYPGAGPSVGSRLTYKIEGFRPEAAGKYPVYVFLTGTYDMFGTPQDFEFVKYMAAKGFVSATVEYLNYDMCFNFCQGGGVCRHSWRGKSNVTIFEKARTIQNALYALCAMDSADCSRGIALMGHSQGGFISMILTLLEPRVSAILPLGVGPLALPDENFQRFEFDNKCILDPQISHHLPRSKRRYTNGEADDLSHRLMDNDNKGLEEYSGHICNTSTTPVNCIQADGSGYYIVSEKEFDAESKATIVTKHGHEIAGHNFFGSHNPVNMDSVLLPAYKHGKAPWCMKPSLDWLAAAAKGPKWDSTLEHEAKL